MPKNKNPYAKIWSRMIPGFAISTQLAMAEILNVTFMSSDPISGVKAIQCHGIDEYRWRTATFLICLLSGFLFMKKFDTDKLFHAVVSFVLVISWLFAISDFPLTCWISTDQPLSEKQARNVFLTRFMITTVVNALAAHLEKEQPESMLNMFAGMETMLRMRCGKPVDEPADKPEDKPEGERNDAEAGNDETNGTANGDGNEETNRTFDSDSVPQVVTEDEEANLTFDS